MTGYVALGACAETETGASLAARLSAWHDAMVVHQRRLRAGRTDVACDDECPHALARGLWAEAVATFGARAHELLFLRSSAVGADAPASIAPSASASASGAGP
jgi:hypothetical protein